MLQDIVITIDIGVIAFTLLAIMTLFMIVDMYQDAIEAIVHAIVKTIVKCNTVSRVGIVCYTVEQLPAGNKFDHIRGRACKTVNVHHDKSCVVHTFNPRKWAESECSYDKSCVMTVEERIAFFYTESLRSDVDTLVIENEYCRKQYKHFVLIANQTKTDYETP